MPRRQARAWRTPRQRPKGSSARPVELRPWQMLPRAFAARPARGTSDLVRHPGLSPALRSVPSLRAERDKAARLHAFAAQASFAELVAYYYRITDDVPPEQAIRYRDYIFDGPRRAAPILDALEPDNRADTLVDLGCGSGGLLVAAAGRYRAV